jgi:hypothetical protein
MIPVARARAARFLRVAPAVADCAGRCGGGCRAEGAHDDDDGRHHDDSAVLAAAQATPIASTFLRPMWSLRSPKATSAASVPST